VPFSRELYIEHDDFREVPPRSTTGCLPEKKWPAQRLFRHAKSVVKDAAGQRNRSALHLRSGEPRRHSPDGRKVKSTMHWVSAAHAISADIRLYDKLFTKADPYDWRKARTFSTISIPTRSKSSPARSLSRRSRTRSSETVFNSSAFGYFCLDPDSAAASWSLPDAGAERFVGEDREKGRSVELLAGEHPRLP